MRARLAVLAAMMSVACSAKPPAPAEPELPQVVSRGGPVMAHPQIVTITFADDSDRDTLEAHAAWIVGSSWITTVGAEYGVGHGSVLGTLHVPASAPAAVTDDEIRAFLAAAWVDGSLPRPADGDLSSVLYFVHYPITTTVTTSTQTSCTGFLGYHQSLRQSGVELAYAVEVACPRTPQTAIPDVLRREHVTSHELIEAATDPFPDTRASLRVRNPNDAWLLLGGEVADLCELDDAHTVVMEDGFAAQRVWSSAAAATLDRDPCVPAPSAPYFNVMVESGTRVRMQAGESRGLTVTGWATGTVADWRIGVGTLGTSAFSAELGTTHMGVGQTTFLTVHAPASASPGTTGKLVIASGHDESDARLVPVWLTIDPPCNSHATCDECATRGCGWCTATQRCEVAAADGSAESACAADQWAPWVGACPGHCASHGSCAECAMQTGCGWCDGVGCMPAALDYAGSADGTCSGAAWSFVPRYCP